MLHRKEHKINSPNGGVRLVPVAVVIVDDDDDDIQKSPYLATLLLKKRQVIITTMLVLVPITAVTRRLIDYTVDRRPIVFLSNHNIIDDLSMVTHGIYKKYGLIFRSMVLPKVYNCKIH